MNDPIELSRGGEMLAGYALNARQNMAELVEQALRELEPGKRLAVSNLQIHEGDRTASVKVFVHVLEADEQPPLGTEWTIYEPLPRLKFSYVNHRQEIAHRQIVAPRIYWGSTDYYPDDQWLVEGFCLDRMAMRVFALNQMCIGKAAYSG